MANTPGRGSARDKSPAARASGRSRTPTPAGASSSSSKAKAPGADDFGIERTVGRAGLAVAFAFVGLMLVMMCSYYLEGGVKAFLRLNFGIQFAGYVIAATFMTESFYDLLGTGTFLAGTIYTASLGSINLQQKILSIMVGLWALRLCIYLVHRFHLVGTDKRFDKAKRDPQLFFVYWTMQGVWISVTLLPVVLVNSVTVGSRPCVTIEYLGIFVWLIGFTIESMADYEKTLFRADAGNKGKFIQTGLWTYCRHPNYFGEIVVWTGVSLFCLPSISGLSILAAVISPVFVYMLLNFLSGVPILEQGADKRWAGNAAYEKYKRTSRPLLFLPWGP